MAIKATAAFVAMVQMVAHAMKFVTAVGLTRIVAALSATGTTAF